MSNLKNRNDHLLDRRVILSTRNAGRISLRNPDAVVLDLSEQSIWQNGEVWPVSSRGAQKSRRIPRKSTKNWRFAVLMICGHAKLVTRDDLYSCLWGEDLDGGPDYPDRYYYVLRNRAGDLFDWVGLTIESRHGLGWSPVLSQRQPLAKAA